MTTPQPSPNATVSPGDVGKGAGPARIEDIADGIRELVAWWSQITLEPGDVITSGSPAGVIAGRENAEWLKPGDRIEATIERLGTLVSVIAAERA